MREPRLVGGATPCGVGISLTTLYSHRLSHLAGAIITTPCQAMSTPINNYLMGENPCTVHRRVYILRATTGLNAAFKRIAHAASQYLLPFLSGHLGKPSGHLGKPSLPHELTRTRLPFACLSFTLARQGALRLVVVSLLCPGQCAGAILLEPRHPSSPQ